jgi:aminopeptidase S
MSSVPWPGARVRLRLWVAAATALVAAACATSPAPAPDTPRTDGPPVVAAGPSEVVGADALVHLKALQDIADSNGGNRASPGPGYEASVDYVAAVLHAAGWDVTTPTYRAGGTSVRQVLAQTGSGTSGKVVMAGAHLDSVRDGPGITDDGSGVAALLAIAEHLGANPAVPHTVRFAFFGSEEDDQQGSRSYVSGVAGPDRDAILVYLNVDMISSSNAGFFVQGGADGETSESGPPGSATVGRILVDQLARTGVAAELIPFTGDDDSAFVEAGIPTGGLINGGDDEKSPQQATAWGGQAGTAFDGCYHAACDRLDQVNQVALDRFTRAIAGAVAQFAVMNGRPTD